MINSVPRLKRHILVVDDEDLVRETIQMVLQLDGHHIALANSGNEALALFQIGRFDLIFTDFFMPSMNGRQLAETIKSLSPQQPVVMITAYPEKFRNSGSPMGALDMIIAKPFELDDLRNAVALADKYSLRKTPPLSC